VRPDTVSASQKQTASLDLDPAVNLDVSGQRRDPPDLAGWWGTTNEVAVHNLTGEWLLALWNNTARDRIDPDSTLEPGQGVPRISRIPGVFCGQGDWKEQDNQSGKRERSFHRQTSTLVEEAITTRASTAA